MVYDSTHECPYIDGQRARLPMRLPTRELRGWELDLRLAEGDRRHGAFLYRPTCPACRSCEPIRLDALAFPLRRSHRRVLRKGDRAFRMEIGEPKADRTRLDLYEKHKRGRHLVTGSGEPLDLKGYEGFLVDRCVRSFEVRFYAGDTLAAVAVTDQGDAALSAVYCFWDPAFASLSPGTYSILKHLELAREWNARFLYLGLYVEENEHMRYKARFVPHERLVGGRWQRFEVDVTSAPTSGDEGSG